MAILESDANNFEQRRHFKLYNVFICMFMGLAGTAYGTTASVIGTTLGQPSFFKAMGLNASNEASLTGAMNSLYYAGGVFGAVCHGWMADRFGRKIDIFAGATMIVVSQALIAGSVNPAMFIVFRFFCGWGGFQCAAGVPLWMAEVVPPGHRGMLSDLCSIMITLGYALTGYVGLGFYFLDTPNTWRGPLALAMIPGVILICGIYWLPESPRYLLTKERYEEAWDVVSRLHSDPKDPHNEFAQREYYQMYKQIQFDASLNEGYRNILSRPSYRKRAFISITLMICTMSSGLLTIINYGVQLYAKLGYNAVQTLLFQTGYLAFAFLWATVAMSFVDKVPRNRLMGTGFAGACVAVALEMILTAKFLHTDNKAGLATAVFAFFLYIFCYNMTLDGPMFFYHAEIWPTHMRARGLTLAMAAYSGINIVWLQAAPTAFKNIGWKYYIFFVVFSAIGSVLCFFVFPDTLHKPLEEIAAIFGDEDLVQVYQKELDSAKIELEVIQEVIPVKGRAVIDRKEGKEGMGETRTQELEDIGSHV
ncbi:hypothetical protein A1O3_00259 [Capronia epimyces CBS 606.96]|uniref:Major facilitator superfamily (MFS) profile domain-containing protein n=1 Tax=Capronia epimyces CBS 606.96 TaxID=1182542 RepID=W9ZAZ8_9EURO|nr:uncharacterized protein A1O3_00259 [Capronia epimyces CBS 606.96]EXJ91709.1 hypothetical protein A1O3_00259 [Capronia epimyces CBS 606.96]